MSFIELNERNFLLFLKEAKINPKLNLNNLAGEGRTDLICRAISSAFFLSNSFRNTTNLFLFYQSESVLLILYGKFIKKIMPDERSIGGFLKQIYAQILGQKKQKKYNLDFSWEYFSLDEIPKYFPNGYLLDIEGYFISDLEINQKLNYIFAIGDHLGLNENDKSFLSHFKNISLGKSELHASSCITITHYLLDTI